MSPPLEKQTRDKLRSRLLGLIALLLLVVVGLLANARSQNGEFPQLSLGESISTLRTPPGHGENKAVEHQLPSQTLRVLDPGDHKDLLAESLSETGVNKEPGGGALIPSFPTGQSLPQSDRIASNTVAALGDISRLNLENLKPDYPQAGNQRKANEDTLKTKSPITASNLPGPGYPVYRPEIVRDGRASSGEESGGSESRSKKPSGSRDGKGQASYDETPAYPIYTPAIFPYVEGRDTRPLVEFTILQDGTFSVELIEGTGSEIRDREVLDGLKFWEWAPAIKNGQPIVTKELVRLNSTALPRDEWFRQKAMQDQQTQLRAKKKKEQATSGR